MAWTEPAFSPEDVNAGGRRLAQMTFPVESQDGFHALDVIDNWRASHAFPLNTFQITARRKARKIEREIIVAQRLKRLESIHRKLTDKVSMRMTQMQDIAGCRVVFRKLASIQKLVELYKSSKFDHKFKGEKDYVRNPKPDGYRSHHLVYTYVGGEGREVYSGLRVEVQIRTQLQHAWATAVEAVGIFTRQALKSNQGSKEWLRFFALMGTVLAAIEGTPSVPGTPTTNAELVNELEQLAVNLDVEQTLQMYNATIETVGAAKDAKYFLMRLDPIAGNITVRRFKAKESAEANRQYTRLEGQEPDESRSQIVLVSVENITALKRAYPNYFLDTKTFAQIVTRALSRDFPDPVVQTSHLAA